MKQYKFAAVVLSAVLALSSCGTEYVGKVGSDKITKSEFEFYLSSVKEQMAGPEFNSDEDWNTKEIEGKKAIDLAKERAFETAVNNLSYIQVAKKLGLEMTAEEQKVIQRYKNMLMLNYGSEEKYNQFLQREGITDKFIDMMCSSMGYTDKLIDKIAEDTPASDEELKKYFKEHYRRAKHVLIMTVDSATQQPLSDEKQAEAKQKAEAVLKRAQDGVSFEALIDEFNEDPGVKSNPDGYVFTDGEMMQEFADGVDSVSVGGITMAQTSYGYHIIKRYALDETPEIFNAGFDSKKESIEYGLNKEKLDKQMDAWIEEYNIKVKKNEDVYNSVNN